MTKWGTVHFNTGKKENFSSLKGKVIHGGKGLNMEYVIYIIQAIVIGIAIANLFELLPEEWGKYKISVITGIIVLISIFV